MPSNDYHFMTRWRVRGTRAEIVEIFSDPTELARWWPSVYLAVRELAPGDARGLGKTVSVYTKGWLPYTLRWQFRVSTLSEARLTLQAAGDFVGRGIWIFAQDGDWADITYDWQIEANKPLLRRLSWALKPIFAANHRWAMAQGETSLQLELARRRARTPAQLARIPAPPPPTSFRVPLILGAALLGAALLLARSARRRRA